MLEETNDFGIADVGPSKLADPEKNFCYRFNTKLYIKLIFRKKCERKLKWICNPQLHLFITFEARRCHLNTRNKEALVCKCFSDLRSPYTSYRVCLIEYVWISFPGCIIFERFFALLRTSRLFIAGGGDQLSPKTGGETIEIGCQLLSIKQWDGGVGNIRILQSLKGRSGKF